MQYPFLFGGASIAIREYQKEAFFRMKDFHIIIWPSLPALFSGEFQFPGQDRYKALRMVPG